MLDRETLKALRQSNHWISLRAEWQGRELVESQIVGKCQDAVGADYTNVVWELPSFLEHGSAILREHPRIRAYGSVSSPRFHDLWRTIMVSLRTGDECKLVWSANGHANSLVHERGLCVDTVELEIVRSNRRLRFHIDTSVTLPNTARMFTAGTWNPDSYLPVVGPNPHRMST